MRRHQPDMATGRAELRASRGRITGLIAPVVLFSACVNLLMLTGPLFMLQVYDRVLGSRSEETLAALFALVVFLFVAMGLLDHARGRVMVRAAARFQCALEGRVFAAVQARAAMAPGDAVAAAGLRDLDAVQRFMASPVLLAVFDMPWTPVFLGAVFLFHPALGLLALAGGGVLVTAALMNQLATRRAGAQAAQAGVVADRIADHLSEEAEHIRALGMQQAGFARWQQARGGALDAGVRLADIGGGFATFSRTMRLFLQSAMLALGAWLVLRGELTAGAMIAASILMGRALAPVEQAVGQWALAQRAQDGWARLVLLLGQSPTAPARTALPRPRAVLEAHQLVIVPPGQTAPCLRGLSFRLEPGQALGVIGPSGAGKSTLARALCGVWPPAAGWIRLDGATLDQYDPDVLGTYVGYLPQRVGLFDGTVAQNIARLSDAPDAGAIVEAARKAGAHQMILDLPEGYDTRLSRAGGMLSGGQIQRIGLARALYGDPVLVVLDEPNSNLDNDGSLALNAAIRGLKADGKSVLIMAHRPAAIAECDLLLVLEAGQRRAFGPRDEVLRGSVRNATEIVRSAGAGGVS